MKKAQKMLKVFLPSMTLISLGLIAPTTLTSQFTHTRLTSAAVTPVDPKLLLRYNNFPIVSNNYFVNFSQNQVTVYANAGNRLYQLNIKDLFPNHNAYLNQINKVVLVHNKLFVIASYFQASQINFGSAMSIFDLASAQILFEKIFSYGGESIDNVFDLGNNQVLLSNYQMDFNDIFYLHKAQVMDLTKLKQQKPAITPYQANWTVPPNKIANDDYLLDLFYDQNNYYFITLKKSSNTSGRTFLSSFSKQNHTYNTPTRKETVWDTEKYSTANQKYRDEKNAYDTKVAALNGDQTEINKLTKPTAPDINNFKHLKDNDDPLQISLSNWVQAAGEAKFLADPYKWPQNNHYFSHNNKLILYLTNQTTVDSKSIGILDLKTFSYDLNPNDFLRFDASATSSGPSNGNKWKVDTATQNLLKDTTDQEKIDVEVTSVVSIDDKTYFTLFSKSAKMNGLVQNKIFYFPSSPSSDGTRTISFYTLKSSDANFPFFRGQLAQKINSKDTWYINESNQEIYSLDFQKTTDSNINLQPLTSLTTIFSFSSSLEKILKPETMFASNALKTLESKATELYEIKNLAYKFINLTFSADDFQGRIRVIATIKNTSTNQQLQITQVYQGFKLISILKPEFVNEFNDAFSTNLANENYALMNLLPSQITPKMLEEKQVVKLLNSTTQSLKLTPDDSKGTLQISVVDSQNPAVVLNNPELFTKTFNLFQSTNLNFQWHLDPAIIQKIASKSANEITLSDFGNQPFIASGYTIKSPLKLIKTNDKNVKLSIVLTQNQRDTKFNYNLKLNSESKNLATSSANSTAIIAGSAAAGSVAAIGIGGFLWWFFKKKGGGIRLKFWKKRHRKF